MPSLQNLGNRASLGDGDALINQIEEDLKLGGDVHNRSRPNLCALDHVMPFTKLRIATLLIERLPGPSTERCKKASRSRFLELARKRANNRARFAATMEVLARYLQRAARDLEAVDEQSWQGKVAGALSGKSAGDRAAHKAMGVLTARLSEATARSTDELIRLHNLSGKAAHQVLERVSGDYAQQLKAPEGASAALGGMLSGAVGGLAADLAAGGLALGGGMIVGAILGALGGTGLAKGINLARGEDGSSVRWSADFLERLTVTALLRYLAVAHFGRGRGEWSEGEHPPFWQPVVEEAVASRKDDLIGMLKSVPVGSVPVARQVGELSSLLAEAGSAILERLYPLAMRVRSA